MKGQLYLPEEAEMTLYDAIKRQIIKMIKSIKFLKALSTEEIVSLLSKSNKDFIKESDISSNITNLFKKLHLHY